MNDTKPWYLSKTVWASPVMIATAGGSLLGLPLGGLDKPAFTDHLVQVVTAVSGLIALLDRLSAEKRINWRLVSGMRARRDANAGNKGAERHKPMIRMGLSNSGYDFKQISNVKFVPLERFRPAGRWRADFEVDAAQSCSFHVQA